jgi:hypothetical protein
MLEWQKAASAGLELSVSSSRAQVAARAANRKGDIFVKGEGKSGRALESEQITSQGEVLVKGLPFFNGDPLTN